MNYVVLFIVHQVECAVSFYVASYFYFLIVLSN